MGLKFHHSLSEYSDNARAQFHLLKVFSRWLLSNLFRAQIFCYNIKHKAFLNSRIKIIVLCQDYNFIRVIPSAREKKIYKSCLYIIPLTYYNLSFYLKTKKKSGEVKLKKFSAALFSQNCAILNSTNRKF